jgi:hypothetical protein
MLMQRHKFMIHSDSPSNDIYVVIECIGPQDGLNLLEMQYRGCTVRWCGPA